MSQKMDSVKVSCLLYLDRPLQADLSDYLNGLTPSRKGEVLREVLEAGWAEYRRANAVGMSPEDIANIIFSNTDTKDKRKSKAKSSKKRGEKILPQNNENISDDVKKGEKQAETEENSVDDKEIVVDKAEESQKAEGDSRGSLGVINSELTLDDIEDNDDEDIDPLAAMKRRFG